MATSETPTDTKQLPVNVVANDTAAADVPERVAAAADATTEVEGLPPRIVPATPADPVAIGGIPTTTAVPAGTQASRPPAPIAEPTPTVLNPETASPPRNPRQLDDQYVPISPSGANASENRPAIARSSRAAGLRPTRIRVGSIGVNARIEPVGLNAERALDVPRNISIPGWWKGGRVPGEDGPTVIVGHVDSKRGPGVFARLRTLQAGDRVDIEQTDGSTFTYLIERVEVHKKKAFPTKSVYGETNGSTLRLITCGGPFNAKTGHYVDNVIAYGTLTS
jgi:Sortase domain